MTHAAAAEPVSSNDTATNDLTCAQPSQCSKPRWEDRRLSTGKILGGVPDVVSDREAMLLPSEDPGALADAIRVVFANPEAAAERARRAGLRLSSAFSAESWLDRHEEIYARAAAQRRRAAAVT